MSTLVDRSERVKIVYDKDVDKIILTGDTVKVSLSITMDQLAGIYTSGHGSGRARVTVTSSDHSSDENKS